MPQMLSHETKRFGGIAFAAGKVILAHYAEGVVAREKTDHSPVTIADEEAEALILASLRHDCPGVAIIAEEAVAAGHSAEPGDRFFLVDPLDGTKEFLKHNGEFTVNIAEIVGGAPVRGVVYAPAQGRMWLGAIGEGAFALSIAAGEAPDFAKAQPIATRPAPAAGMIACTSRSHRDSKTEDYLQAYCIADFIAVGSSLKFCLVASGAADIYPRHGTTMEWDTAAGHAVLAAAGGAVTELDGTPLSYGKPGFENPHFIARGQL